MRSFGRLLLAGALTYAILQVLSVDSGQYPEHAPAEVSFGSADKDSIFDAEAASETSAPALRPAPPADKAALIEEIRFVTAKRLRLRSGPSTDDAILTSLPLGSQLVVRESQNDWLRIAAPDGTAGWVHRGYTSPLPPAEIPPDPPPTVSARNTPNADGIADQIIERSIRNYPGNCPCPYNYDRAGRHCGQRSAYSRPGGRAPICFRQDVSDEMIAKFR